MSQSRVSRKTRNAATVLGAFIVIGVIIWADVATGVWNELVILSGLAAGLVTFLLTALVLDRLVARNTERKWAPVNRLALTEFLHAIADEDRSEISRGHIVPRELPLVRGGSDGPVGSDDELRDELERLRAQVVEERRLLSEALSRWAEFLASSGANEQVLRHIADIALRLDGVRDAALEAEEVEWPGVLEAFSALEGEIEGCNTAMRALERELRERIGDEDRLARGAR